jgi:ElaB/YqjD/DUF883 family membrane-anchored ribosome-binding protein
MEERRYSFLEAEEIANELVKSLEKLEKNARSYQSAAEELEKVRQRLTEFISQTGELVKQVFKVINTLEKIGTPEILSQIGFLNERVSSEFSKNENLLNDLRDKNTDIKNSIQQVLITLANSGNEMQMQLKNFNDKFNDLINENTTVLKNSIQQVITSLLETAKELQSGISNITDKMHNEFSNQTKNFQDKLSAIDAKFEQNLSGQSEKLSKLKILIYIAIISSVMSIAINIISLIR